MKPQILEGTWEEILLHAPKLAGQRVRLTVLTNQTGHPDNPIPLDQLLKDRVGRVQFEPSNLSEYTGEIFTKLLAEQNQSLELKE